MAAEGLGGVLTEHMRHRILGQVRPLRENGVECPTNVVVIGRVRDLQDHQGQNCSGIVLLLAISLPSGGYLLQLVGAAAHQHGIELSRLLRHVQDDRILQQT